MRTRLQTIFVAAVFSLLCVFSFGNSKALATIATAPNGTIVGKAWSSNIGWISFNNCTDETTCAATGYGVTADIVTGVLSGYAWSSNIGWISFNAVGAPSTQPQSDVQAKIDLTTGAISGWARACSVFASGCSGALLNDSVTGDIYRGGWDGYIALNDSNTTGANGWGLVLNNDKSISGDAWGSDVIGWIKGVDLKILVATPTVTIEVSPATINSGDDSDLSWNATNSTSCTGTNFDTNGSLSDSITVSPGSSTTYVISCTNGVGGTATAQATLTVLPSCGAGQSNTTGQCLCTSGTRAGQVPNSTGTPCPTTVITPPACLVPPNIVNAAGACVPADPTSCASVGLTFNATATPPQCIKKIKPIFKEN